MKCQEANELLIPYLNNEVTRSERELLQAHLAQCEPCWQALSALSAAQQRLRSGLAETARRVEAPEQAWPRLRAAIRSNPQPRLALRLPVLSSLGALVVAGLAALMVTAPLGAPTNFAPVVHDPSTRFTAPPPTLVERGVMPTTSSYSSATTTSTASMSTSVSRQALAINPESASPLPQNNWLEEASIGTDDSLERITNAEPQPHTMPLRKAESKACRCVRAL